MDEMRLKLLEGRIGLPGIGAVRQNAAGLLPYAVVDEAGREVEVFSVFLRDLVLTDMSPLTVRSYGNDVLRWWRVLQLIGVPWDQAGRLEVEVQYQRCAGLDVSKRGAKACVRITAEGQSARQEITTWTAMTNEVNRLAEYLLDQDVGVVVIEATGDYWRQFYFLLEDKGLNVQLVHAKDARNLPGRKPDVSDAAWLADLGAHGLVRASFVPPPPIRELTRTRTAITDERSREVQRLEKMLEDSGIKLSSIATDITGVSGRAMLQALIEGQNDPAVLADLAKKGMRRKIPALTEALTGRFNDHHAFMARLFLNRIDAHSTDIAALDARIDELMRPFSAARELLGTIPSISNRTAVLAATLN